MSSMELSEWFNLFPTHVLCFHISHSMKINTSYITMQVKQTQFLAYKKILIYGLTMLIGTNDTPLDDNLFWNILEIG